MISLRHLSQGDRCYYFPKCTGGENLALPLPDFLCPPWDPLEKKEQASLKCAWPSIWACSGAAETLSWRLGTMGFKFGAFLKREIETSELLFASAARGGGQGQRTCQEPSSGDSCFPWCHYLLDARVQDKKAVFPKWLLPFKALRISSRHQISLQISSSL